jgi:transposase-like protein
MTEAQTDHRNKMLALARAWQESGTPARRFAQEHGVTAWTLYYWRQRRARQARAARRPRLAPVHVVETPDDRGHDLEIVLASGDCVRVSAQISGDALRRVIDVLRARC